MRKLLLIIATLLFMPGFTACTASKCPQEITTTMAGQHYLLYFLNNNEFSTAGYYTETTDTGELINELLGEMGLINDDVVDGELSVIKTNVSNGTAYIYFNEAYNTMANVYEVLFRASIVKTLSQLPEVNYVYFYIENMALTYDNGEIVGLMSEADFIADSDSDLANLAWDTITLYFAALNGEGLVEQQVDVAYIKTVSKERLVVEQVIQGPDDDSVLATVNSQVKVLGVTVNNKVCYVNLDASFTEPKAGIPFELTVYSIVNSLCELDGVDKVQFQINGDSHIEANDLSFDTYYTNNLDLIYKEDAQ